MHSRSKFIFYIVEIERASKCIIILTKITLDSLKIDGRVRKKTMQSKFKSTLN
jgi:hypothetical protein